MVVEIMGMDEITQGEYAQKKGGVNNSTLENTST